MREKMSLFITGIVLIASISVTTTSVSATTDSVNDKVQGQLQQSTVQTEVGPVDYSEYPNNVIVSGGSRTFHVEGTYRGETVSFDYTISLYPDTSIATVGTASFEAAIGTITYHIPATYSHDAVSYVFNSKACNPIRQGTISDIILDRKKPGIWLDNHDHIVRICSVTYDVAYGATYTVPKNAFQQWGSTDLFIPDCWNLEDVYFDEGLTEIGTNAFCACTRLSGLHFPTTSTRPGCISFPTSLTKIGSCAFTRTTSFYSDIEFPTSNSTVEIYSLPGWYNCHIIFFDNPNCLIHKNASFHDGFDHSLVVADPTEYEDLNYFSPYSYCLDRMDDYRDYYLNDPDHTPTLGFCPSDQFHY